MITARAIERPRYFNASSVYSKWVTHNWHMLHQYFVQCGGDLNDSAEYVEFAKTQFDLQSHSPQDEKILHDANEQTVRDRVEMDDFRNELTRA